MAEASRIIGSSIHSFFCHYHTFASVATVLILPCSAATLLSQALLFPSSSSSSGTLQSVSGRLHSLFAAATFPADNSFFALLNLKLSQTIFTSIFTLPFCLTFLCLAKASIALTNIHDPQSPSLSSFLKLYTNLLHTHLFNIFLIISANSAVFSSLFMVFEFFDFLGIKSSSLVLIPTGIAAVFYSVIFSNVAIVCNLASIVSAMERCRGYNAILRAWVLIRGKVTAALFLALFSNLGLAAIEALFQMRITRAYHRAGRFDLSLFFEGLTVTYMYSILSVLDIVISFSFFKSCRHKLLAKYNIELELEEKGSLVV
ncbi:hypothetical protein AXF42_Ash001499 [Apostasia shenzhenica]|uniref:Uncharacterized protein n=1 Tax=Apostasia shenzhenica TaxID=1088818 RepID=A0A2I0AAE2_9ASPA|nr:hypothetical protein AXF42_Ash001499 [Apostasia shenzhenica]